MAARGEYWWQGEPAERYWMESIARPQFGDVIKAPHRTRRGATSPFYSSVNDVQNGDVVLHWATGRNRPVAGFVGFSVVDGLAYPVDEVDYDDEAPRPGVQALLRDFTEFSTPLTLHDLSVRRHRIFEVGDSLRTLRPKSSALFPFDPRAGGKEIRVHQGAYLAKFPSALFDVLPELAEAKLAPLVRPGRVVAAGSPSESRLDRRRARESGDVGDAALRRAVEALAIRQAREFYESTGHLVTDLGASRPVDLLATPEDGSPARPIIVLGSTGTIDHLDLSVEALDALHEAPTDLVLVQNIPWERHENQVVVAEGDFEHVPGWRPSVSAWTPVRYRYTFGG